MAGAQGMKCVENEFDPGAMIYGYVSGELLAIVLA